MTQSNTPETDAASKLPEQLKEYFVVPSHIARKLERERDEARRELSNCKSHFSIHDGKELDESVHMAVLHALAERDQLRAENSTLRNAQKACEDCDAPTMEEVKQLRKVADELADRLSVEIGFDSCLVDNYYQLPHVKQKESQ